METNDEVPNLGFSLSNKKNLEPRFQISLQFREMY